jgi:flagellar hook-associated protein 2
MAISLGNFFSSNGRTVLGGLGGSGLDTESLINSLTEAKALPKTKLQDKVDLNDKKVAAYGELRTLMTTLKDAANFLRNPPGFGNADDNVFKYRTATTTSNTAISASNYVTVAAEPGASVQTYNISEINSLARATKQRTGTFAIATADTSAVTSAFQPGFFKAGTVAVNGTSITLVAGDTLNQVASKFNDVKDDTGITASVIQAGENDFRLVFTATNSGTAAAFDLNVPSDAVPTDASGVFSMISRTNLLTNGTFASNITGWTNESLGTGTIAHSSGKLQLDGDGAGGNEAFARQAMTTVIGQQYTVRATLSDLTSSAYIRIGTGTDVNNASNYDIADHEVAADGTVSFTFTATSTTTQITFNSAANTSAIHVDDVSVVANATQAVTTTQTATDAEFVIDGVTVTRSSNSIADVVSGVTFNLLSETPALTELSVDIIADQSLPKSGIINFVNAFNALRIFAAEQGKTNDDGTFAEESFLANDALLKNTMNSISTELSRIVNNTGTLNTLATLGVTFTDLPESSGNPFTRNVLTIDEGKLDTALATSFSSVESLFGFGFTSSNSNLAIFSRTNALSTTEFTVTANTVTNTFTATVGDDEYTLTATSLGASGYSLSGVAGTPLEGLVMIYGSTTSGTADVTVAQGIADRIFNLADSVLDTQEGTLKSQVDSITSTNTRYEEEMKRIEEQVERFRESLLEKFGALESVLSSVNTLLNSLDAQQQARNNAS